MHLSSCTLSSISAADVHLRAVKHSLHGPPAELTWERLYWTSLRQLEGPPFQTFKRSSCKKSQVAERHYLNALKALYPPPRHFYITEDNKTPGDECLLQVLHEEDMNDINQPEIRRWLVGVLLTVIGKLPGCFYWRLHFIEVYLTTGSSAYLQPRPPYQPFIDADSVIDWRVSMSGRVRRTLITDGEVHSEEGGCLKRPPRSSELTIQIKMSHADRPNGPFRLI